MTASITDLTQFAPSEISLLPGLVLDTNGLESIRLGAVDRVYRNEATGVVTAIWSNDAKPAPRYHFIFSSDGEWIWSSPDSGGSRKGKIKPVTDPQWFDSFPLLTYFGNVDVLDYAVDVWRDLIKQQLALDAIIDRLTVKTEDIRSDAVRALWQKIKNGEGNAALKDLALLKANLQDCIDELDAISDAVTTRLGVEAVNGEPEVVNLDSGR
jgi:hypothetical protein